MRTVFLLARKDLRQRLRDKSFILMGIIAPLAITFILTSVAGDAFEGRFQPIYRVYDATNLVGPDLVEGLVREAGFEDIELVSSRTEAVAAVEEGEATAAILIPAELIGSGPATIEVVGSVTGYWSSTVAAAIAEGMASEVTAARLAGAGLVAAGVNDPGAFAGLSSLPPVIEVIEVGAGTRVLDGRTYLAVGMALFFLFFSVQGAVMNVIEERQEGTLQRLLVAPVARSSILVGKTLSAAVTGLLSMAVLVLATTFLLKADWGDPWGVVLLSISAVVAAMGLGAILATVTRTAEQAGQFGGIVATVLGLLGGVFFPIAGDGGWLDAVSRISPHRWLIEGLGANAGTGEPIDVVIPALVVLAFGAILGGAALARRSRLTGVV